MSVNRPFCILTVALCNSGLGHAKFLVKNFQEAFSLIFSVFSFVKLQNGLMGKIKQLLLVKVPGGRTEKYIRVSVFRSTNIWYNFEEFVPTLETIVVNAKHIERQVIAYQHSANEYLCIDFMRPSFSYDYDFLP